MDFTSEDFIEISTERLLLREINEFDRPIILQAYSDPRVNQYMSVSYHSLEEVNVQLEWYQSIRSGLSGNYWGICFKSDGTLIGNAGFYKWDHKHRNAELGYWLLPEFQGRGYGTEAFKAIIDFGFQKMNLHRIEAIIEPENRNSILLVKRLGFELDGIRRECEFVNGKFIDLQIWSILNK